MPDITMCQGDNCPIKDKCYRFTAHADELWQSYANFEYKHGCDFFWDNKDKPKKKEKK